MRRSWSKFVFVKCKFQLPNSFDRKCRFTGLENIKTKSKQAPGALFLRNRVKLDAFVGIQGSALLEMLAIVFKAHRFICMKLLAAQGFSPLLTFRKRHLTYLTNLEYDENVQVRMSLKASVNFVTSLT